MSCKPENDTEGRETTLAGSENSPRSREAREQNSSSATDQAARSPPEPPRLFSRSYVGGTFASSGASSYGLGVDAQVGSIFELDLENGYLRLGDYAATSEILTSNVAPRSANVSFGIFLTDGGLAALNGASVSYGGSVTFGKYGGVAVSYSSDGQTSTASIAYTYGGAGSPVEVNTARSKSSASFTETINLNLEHHIMREVGRQTGQGALFELYAR